MSAYEELLCQIRDTAVPDKDRILRTRALLKGLAERIDDPASARQLTREMNSAYLDLQLATLSDDAAVTERCRKACEAIAKRIVNAGSKSAATKPLPAAAGFRPFGA